MTLISIGFLACACLAVGLAYCYSAVQRRRRVQQRLDAVSDRFSLKRCEHIFAWNSVRKQFHCTRCDVRMPANYFVDYPMLGQKNGGEVS